MIPMEIRKIIVADHDDGTTVPQFFSGSMNGNMFLGYIQHKLIPSLHAGDLVIMDNLRCHKVKGIKEAIQQTGAQLLYLPPYSPDFNPIERMWSKLKAILRKVKTRTVDSLLAALPKVFQAVSVSDIMGWFCESGYSLS